MLRNESAEVTVVPEIGRVMRFDLRGTGAAAPQGPFWSPPTFDRWMRADPEGWINYGGDKAWPAPQSDWPKLVGRAWPPPTTFDAQNYVATALGSKIWMESSTDPHYGLAIERVLSLDPTKPVLTITTTYRKISGDPVRVGVWSITQLAPPERLFVQLAPPPDPAAKRFENLMTTAARDLRIEDNVLSMTADPSQKTMIAAEGSAMLWVGSGPALLMEALPARNVKPPRLQLYTSPGPGHRYVELEFVTPVSELRPGDHATLIAQYTLIPRVDADTQREAQRILGNLGTLGRGATPPPARRATPAPTRQRAPATADAP
ncbi:MAG TPA: DUF4380 domain-containing protein [Polyangia bacterium]|nr:DUF4380 domain-containing protein [Polyangia bacterium]